MSALYLDLNVPSYEDLYRVADDAVRLAKRLEIDVRLKLLSLPDTVTYYQIDSACCDTGTVYREIAKITGRT